MNTKHRIKTILPLVAVAMVGFTPAAQAATVELTSSTQLNLTGRDVLAAVNFWDPERAGNGQSVVGEIQGVEFSDFDNNDVSGSFAVAEGTMSFLVPNQEGREFALTLLPASADNTQTELLMAGGFQFTSPGTTTMTFDFGAEWAGSVVEVQMPGGGLWNKLPGMKGIITPTIGGVPMGTLQDDAIPYLLTFETTLDASGDLAIDMVFTGDRWAILQGITVTTGPAASTLAITSITSLGSGVFELTLKGENNTSYEFYSSTTLNFDTVTLVPLTVSGTPGQLDVTTDGSGNATVQMSPGGSANFVRAGGGP